MIKEVAWKFYPMLMSTAVKTKHSLGGVEELMDRIFKTRVTIYNRELSDSLESKMRWYNHVATSEITSIKTTSNIFIGKEQSGY